MSLLSMAPSVRPDKLGERVHQGISDALGQGAITQDQYAALFNYSLDVFEDTARATEEVTASLDNLRDAAKSLADELLVSDSYTTLAYGQQLAEARQYDEAMQGRRRHAD